MAEPKYLDSLRSEIAVLDRKIDDFHEKFDHKVDRLSENLHEVEKALTEVSTSLKAFTQRFDKAGDRQWQLFLGVIGLTVSFIGASAATFWQVRKRGAVNPQFLKPVVQGFEKLRIKAGPDFGRENQAAPIFHASGILPPKCSVRYLPQ